MMIGTIPPVVQGGMIGGTSTGAVVSGMCTNCKYFVMYFDTSIGGYRGTWWDTDEEAAEDVRKIQSSNSCTHVVILTKDQEWLRTWERR